MGGVDNTTVRKKLNINLRQRTSETDLNEFSDLAQENIAINNFELVCALSRMIRGMALSFNSGRIFDVGVGSAIWKGEEVRNTAATTVTLAENADPNPRIDLVEITGVTDTTSDLGLKVALSALSRTSVSGEAVGSGTGSQKAWDLDYAGVDGSTLKVQLAGTAVGGWNLSPGTGTLGVDQVIFYDAPGSGVAITADYDYLTGGVESSALINTRKSQTPTFNVITGTPTASPSPPSGTSGAVHVGTIEVPGSWTGGGGSVAYSYEERQYMVHEDEVKNEKSVYTASDDNAGKLINPIRMMHGIMAGFRLVYVSGTSFKITPGWGVSLGQAFYSTADIEETGLALGSAGWRYVYLNPPSEAGNAPTIANISSDPPRSDRMIQAATNSDLYVGAIYWDGAAVREFYTRGDWTYWASATAQSLTVPTSGTITDLVVTPHCPSTGRTLMIRAQASLGASASNGTTSVAVKSQRAANVADPIVRQMVAQAGTSLAVIAENNGVVIAEEDSSVRYINYDTNNNGSVTSAGASVYVLGYKDDYRTMTTAGAPDTY